MTYQDNTPKHRRLDNVPSLDSTTVIPRQQTGRAGQTGGNGPDPGNAVPSHTQAMPKRIASVAPVNPYGNAGAARALHSPSKPRKGRGALIALLVVLALIAIAYGGGVYAFSNICYPNTYIAGVDVSLMTRDTAASRVQAAAENYKLTITGGGFEWVYDPESSSDVFDGGAAVDRVIAANTPFTWPIRLMSAYRDDKAAATTENRGASGLSADDIELPDSFDREAFSTDLAQAIDAFNAMRPGTFDAAGALDTEQGKFTLEKARSSQKLNPEPIEQAALLAISQLTRTVELGENCYVPLVNGATDEQLQAALDEANSLIAAKIDLTMAGATVATLDGTTMAGWMTFDEQLHPTLNTDQVSAWVRDLAQAKLDTVGIARTYTRADGKQVKVSGGTFGWMSDEAALVTQLNEAVAAKRTGAIEVPLKQKAERYGEYGGREWGAYIDIDLSEQYARYYDASDNVLWESSIISGNPNTDHATPTGVYRLNQKSRNMTLVGLDEDKDGEPDYKTPVSYWMPFVGGAVGLHDADWQSSAAFADPSAYTYRGSHGCVNLPPAKAAELYDIIPDGICVITHY